MVSLLCVLLIIIKIISSRKAILNHSDDKLTRPLIILTTLSIGITLVISTQITLGLFTSSSSSRQFAGTIISLITFSSSYFFSKNRPEINFSIKMIILIFCFTQISNISKNKFISQFDNKEFHQCLTYLNQSKKSFVADFWLKVPLENITVVRGVSLETLDIAFTNGQNVKKTRSSKPEIAITNGTFSKNIFIENFGTPYNIIQCRSDITLLDYSNNKKFIEHFTKISLNAK